MILLGLVQNLALVVALAATYRVLTDGWQDPSTARKAASGALFGLGAVLGMIMAVEVSPGVIFDARSILLAVAGFIGGPVVALVGAVIAVAARVWLGGAGALVGVGVIVESAAWGAIFRAWYQHSGRAIGFRHLWGFGLVVHVTMVLILYGLPSQDRSGSWPLIATVVLTLYPLATALICRIFLDYEARDVALDRLRESRERMQLALEGAELGVWDWNVKTNEVVFSDRWAEMLGYRPDELDADLDTWRRRVHPDDRVAVERALDDHLAGRSATYETEHRLLHRSGRWVWVLDRGRVLEWDREGRPARAAGTHLDVTHRKEAEAALREALVEQSLMAQAVRESEERYRTLFLANHAVMLIVDSDTGHVVDANPAAVSFYGYARSTLLGMSVQDLTARPGGLFAAAPVGRDRGRAYPVRGTHRRADGTECAVDVYTDSIQMPEGLRLLSIVRDVTVEAEALERLMARERDYRVLFASSPQVLWVYDLETLAFLDVNEAAERQYGYTREEFLAMTIKDIRPPEDVPALLERVAQTAEGIDEAGLWRHHRKDGSLMHVEVRSHSLSYAGRPAELVMVTDVTEWKRQEEQIRALTEGLEEQVRSRTRLLKEANEELEAFSYSVSHDLKAPLRTIDGYSAVLESRAASGWDLESAQLVAEIRQAAQHMGHLIEDLLAFSRVARSMPMVHRVDLGSIVRDLVDREREAAPDRVVELDLGELPAVEGDTILLTQALSNLLGNAVKFTRPRPVARISVRGRRERGWVTVVIEDNGVGFDPRYGHKLFRVFERLHYPDEFEGTGVGLAIVKRIVDRHGGSVTIESDEGSGTRVELSLPAARGGP